MYYIKSIKTHVKMLVNSIVLPRKEGWKSASGHRNLSFPMVTRAPSGSSYDFSMDDDLAQTSNSFSRSRAV